MWSIAPESRNQRPRDTKPIILNVFPFMDRAYNPRELFIDSIIVLKQSSFSLLTFILGIEKTLKCRDVTKRTCLAKAQKNKIKFRTTQIRVKWDITTPLYGLKRSQLLRLLRWRWTTVVVVAIYVEVETGLPRSRALIWTM